MSFFAPVFAEFPVSRQPMFERRAFRYARIKQAISAPVVARCARPASADATDAAERHAQSPGAPLPSLPKTFICRLPPDFAQRCSFRHFRLYCQQRFFASSSDFQTGRHAMRMPPPIIFTRRLSRCRFQRLITSALPPPMLVTLIITPPPLSFQPMPFQLFSPSFQIIFAFAAIDKMPC